jgi:hypothetical protein
MASPLSIRQQLSLLKHALRAFDTWHKSKFTQ